MQYPNYSGVKEKFFVHRNTSYKGVAWEYNYNRETEVTKCIEEQSTQRKIQCYTKPFSS